MKDSPARILETRHWSDERLCHLIERFHDAGPTEDDLAGVHRALEETLGSELHELFAEQASGVRVAPLPPLARPEEPPFEALALALAEPPFEPPFEEKPRAVPSEPIEPLGFWSNPTVSRTLAAFSVAAVMALLWTRVERTNPPVASPPHAFDVRNRGNANSFAPAPRPGAREPRSAPRPAAHPLRTADIEAARKPATRAHVANTPVAGTRNNPGETGGKLNINSIPYSKVVLDGRPLGDTPRVQVTVAAGPHTVLFVHPELGRIQKEVYVDSGRTVVTAVRFD
jgi:PEGA domain-containing protein